MTLPSNADAENLLSSSSNYCIENEDSIQIGENYVTLIVEGNTNTWYIATCTKKNDDGTYEMDHLCRVDNYSDFRWKHPAKADFDNLKPESIVECHINGKWDVSGERNITCILWNHEYIKQLVQELVKWYLQTSVGHMLYIIN